MSISSTLPLFISQANIRTSQMECLDQDISQHSELMQSTNYGTLLDCDADARISGQEKIAEIKMQEQENTRQLARQNEISSQVNDVHKIAEKLRKLTMNVGHNCTVREAFTEQVRGYLEQIEGIMNREHDGNQTLAGKELKGQSVNIKNLPEIIAGQGLKHSYYTGQDGNQSISIDDSTKVNLYPITGKDDAFAKTIQAARLLLTIDPTNTTSAAFTEARDLIKGALKKDFPDAIYKTNIEIEKLKESIRNASKLIVIETERIEHANKITQMDAMRITKELEQTRDITMKVMSNNSILDNRNIETIMRGFPQ